MTIILIIIIVCMISCAALLSAIETAITASSPGKIQKLFKIKNSNRNAMVLQILKNKEKVISTLLIGSTLLNVICTTTATSIFINILGDSGTVIASAVMAFIIIVFGEIIPKAIAVSKAEQLALFTAPVVIFFLKLLKPINYIFEIIVKFFCYIMKINLQQNISGTEEVRGIIEHYHQEGNVYKADRDMLGGILDIRKMTVAEIMIHRSNVIAINIDIPKEEIIKYTLLYNPHTRIPVWKDSQENIIGILHIKDLLRTMYEQNNNIEKIDILNLINQPWFIPDNALVTHQLHAFKERKNHFACVVDEYGDLQGIITLEDILEEIVGPIVDEHDYSTNQIIQISEEKFIINGSVTIRDVNRKLNWSLPDNEANTIAGLIINKLERIPNEGELIIVSNLEIFIKKKIGNKIDTVKVTVLLKKIANH